MRIDIKNRLIIKMIAFAIYVLAGIIYYFLIASSSEFATQLFMIITGIGAFFSPITYYILIGALFFSSIRRELLKL